jgi:hypothetical protein
VGQRLLAYVFPKAGHIPQLQRLADSGSNSRIIMAVNPEWDPLNAPEDSYAALAEPVFSFTAHVIAGAYVTVLRVFPGGWQIYNTPPGESAEMVAIEASRPSMARFHAIVEAFSLSRRGGSGAGAGGQGGSHAQQPASPSTPPPPSGAGGPRGGSPLRGAAHAIPAALAQLSMPASPGCASTGVANSQEFCCHQSSVTPKSVLSTCTQESGHQGPEDTALLFHTDMLRDFEAGIVAVKHEEDFEGIWDVDKDCAVGCKDAIVQSPARYVCPPATPSTDNAASSVELLLCMWDAENMEAESRDAKSIPEWARPGSKAALPAVSTSVEVLCATSECEAPPQGCKKSHSLVRQAFNDAVLADERSRLLQDLALLSAL